MGRETTLPLRIPPSFPALGIQTTITFFAFLALARHPVHCFRRTERDLIRIRYANLADGISVLLIRRNAALARSRMKKRLIQYPAVLTWAARQKIKGKTPCRTGYRNSASASRRKEEVVEYRKRSRQQNCSLNAGIKHQHTRRTANTALHK